MAEVTRLDLGHDLAVEVHFTDVEDGDFRIPEVGRCLPPAGESRRRAIIDRPWTWISQVHEATVLRVEEPGQHRGAVADGLVTATPGCPIAVTTADCAPVVLVAAGGIAVVHAGWRGLMAGIIDVAARQLSAIGGQPVTTLLGPSISPEVYEFGRAELDQVAHRFGKDVASHTAEGKPALDVPAAVAIACEQAGWPAPGRPPCTSNRRWFSHRVRHDLGRQTAVAWLDGPQTGPGVLSGPPV